ncbi:MAG: hypothetical protein ACI4NO_05385 [Oxalobacter sp.]
MKKIIAALLGMAVMSAPFAHDFHGPRHPQGHRPHHEMRRHSSHHGHPHIPPPRHRVEYHKHYHGNNVAEAVIVGGAIVTAAVILAN